MPFDDGIRTVSGAVANFNDGADEVPCISVVCEIKAKPSGGTASNPIPLTGYTSSECYHAGKNLLNPSLLSLFSSNKYIGTANYNSEGTIDVLGDKNYVISFAFTITDGRVRYWDANGNQISNVSLSNKQTLTLTTPSNAVKMSFYAGQNTAQTSVADFEPMLEIGSTASAYKPFIQPKTYTEELGRTVYFGNVNHVTGLLTITHGSYTFTGNEGWTRQQTMNKYYTSSPNSGYFVRDAKLPANNNSSVPISTDVGEFNIAYNRLHNNPDGMCIATDARIGIHSNLYTGSGTLQGVTLHYELKNYITVQLTGQEIQSLLGANNFWNNTNGTTEVTYHDNVHGFASINITNIAYGNLWDTSKGRIQYIDLKKGTVLYCKTESPTTHIKVYMRVKGASTSTQIFDVTSASGVMSYTLPNDIEWLSITEENHNVLVNNGYGLMVSMSSAADYTPVVEPLVKTTKFHKVIYGGQADVVSGICEPKNLFDVGTQRSDYNRGQVTNVSDGVVSFEVYSGGNTFAYRNYNIETFGTMTFSAVASKKSSRFIIRIRNKANTAWLSNNDITITGWNYNAVFGGWYKENSSTTEPTQTATIPNTDASFWQLGLGYANTYTTVGETETISDIMVEEGSTASSYVPHFEPFSFQPISMETDEGENTLFANEGDSAITYRKAVD